jgi:hypothetical protein
MTEPTTPTQLTCDFASLVNEVAYQAFGLRPTTTDVITEDVANANQTADILRAIGKGLHFVYSAHRWSFLRPVVSITTHAAYSTGTIGIDALGNVTGVGTTFPTYSASAGGWLRIPGVGSFAVATYTSGTALVLGGYDGGAVASTIYSLGFDSYPLPSGVETLEGELTLPQGASNPRRPLVRVPEVQIRKMLAHNDTPGEPHTYAETTATPDPTGDSVTPASASARYVTFFPVPSRERVYSAVGVLRPQMIDATNCYPLGGEVLSQAIVEACLAAVERDLDGKDANHPEAVHSRMAVQLLGIAVQQDKDRSSPDTLGIAHDGERKNHHGIQSHVQNGIYWDGGSFAGWI